MSTERIKVFIVDDHPVVQKGLYGLLQSAKVFDCVALATDGEEAVRLTQEFKPDVAVIDVDMPKMTGIEAARIIKSSCPDTAVLMVSAFNYDHFILGSIRTGADGYVLKTAPPDKLNEAIKDVHNGKKVFDIEATTRILRSLPIHQESSVSHEMLSHRELEVLKYVAKGMSNKQVAATLNISEHTVGTHLIKVFRKLEVESRTEAVRFAFEHGWVTRDRDVKGSE